MKKLICFSVISISVLISMTLAQDIKAQEIRYSQQKIDTLYRKNQMIVINASKDTTEIAAMKNGKKHGKQTLYYYRGQVQRIAHFKDGILHGKVSSYWSHKNFPYKIEHYKAQPKSGNSVLQGLSETFGNDGKLLESFLYEDGLKNGNYKLFYANGTLKEQGTYENDLKKGKRLVYSQQGSLLSEENYIIIDNPKYSESTQANSKEKQAKKISVLHGKVKYYSHNGSLLVVNQMHEGKKEGLCVEYYDDRANLLKSKVVFKNNLEHGPMEHYQRDGKLERKGTFYREIQVKDELLKNVFDGRFEIYFDNGNLQRVEIWKNFKKNGVQESYYTSGTISERTNFVDNLKCGKEEIFDKDGKLSAEIYYEIVEQNGKLVSQKTGTETRWQAGKLQSTTNWVNGLQNGETRTYYPNGQLERVMNFKDGKLEGKYQTYYENGSLKEDLTKQTWKGAGNGELLGWNTTFDEQGRVIWKKFGLGNSQSLIQYSFENGKPTELLVNKMFRLTYNEDGKLSAVQCLSNHHEILSFYLFFNDDLRRIKFGTQNHHVVTSNFGSSRTINQIFNQSNQQIEEKSLIELAQKTSKQFNPNWVNETLAKINFPEGEYQWNYANGQPFFRISFSENLPSGNWIFFNPTFNDTLLYCEFREGFPSGKLVKKQLDGSLILRESYYPNLKLKESYNYNNGILTRVSHLDSTGKSLLNEEYYDNGQLKIRTLNDSKINYQFAVNGDTTSYNIVNFVENDSIRIQRTFYTGNKIRQEKIFTVQTGIGKTKNYFESGQISTFHETLNNKNHGLYLRYYENGSLQVQGEYKEGQQHGQWIKYQQDGTKEIDYFNHGVLSLEKILEKIEAGSCRCIDTTSPASKIGFPQLLKHLSEYPISLKYFPKGVIPIESMNWDKLFYKNLQTNNHQSAGFAALKLITFNELSFYYPANKYLKINLSPCEVNGHVGSIDVTVNYNFENRELTNGDISPKRISVGLVNNPLQSIKNQEIYTAYFETKRISFNANGLHSIELPFERDNCFPKGIINNFMEIEIIKAELITDPNTYKNLDGIPVLPKELNNFYGFEINEAKIKFEFEKIDVYGRVLHMKAGGNFVAGRILIEGTFENDQIFTLQNGVDIDLKKLVKTFELNSFYRVKTERDETGLVISFFTEK